MLAGSKCGRDRRRQVEKQRIRRWQIADTEREKRAVDGRSESTMKMRWRLDENEEEVNVKEKRRTMELSTSCQEREKRVENFESMEVTVIYAFHYKARIVQVGFGIVHGTRRREEEDNQTDTVNLRQSDSYKHSIYLQSLIRTLKSGMSLFQRIIGVFAEIVYRVVRGRRAADRGRDSQWSLHIRLLNLSKSLATGYMTMDPVK